VGQPETTGPKDQAPDFETDVPALSQIRETIAVILDLP
jgi:hypothetical protein